MRHERAARFRDYLGRVTPTALTAEVEVFEEEFQHLRYARRDLAHFA